MTRLRAEFRRRQKKLERKAGPDSVSGPAHKG